MRRLASQLAKSCLIGWETTSSHELPPGITLAQERKTTFGETSRIDARVSLLKAVFVLIAIQLGREVNVRPNTEMAPTVPAGMPQEITRGTWEQLDEVNVSEMFVMRVLMLKSCPRFLRGRLRFSFFVSLRERLRCKLEQDMQGENRAWKLFALVPMLILHRPKHVGSGSAEQSLEGSGCQSTTHVDGCGSGAEG